MNGMSITIKCHNCGATAQIATENYHDRVNFTRCLLDQKFSADIPDIEKIICNDPKKEDAIIIASCKGHYNG